MYQLGLSPAAAEVPSMSAVALGANRWASRVVVVLQLAAWSAVGIVLLQKGVSSLQKTPVDVKNATKGTYNETTVANLMMKRVLVESDVELSREQEYSKTLENPESPISPEDGLIPEGKSVLPLSSLTPNHLSDDGKKPVSIPDKDSNEDHRRNQKIDSREEDDRNSTSWLRPTSTIAEKSENAFETRKRLRTSNLSGAGGAAAAAVAMVAVGAVMLVLGPVVIILRALDERRQERRFLKLSGQDDLPPSYEQATLMDEAPRYSTLSLNTIGCSSGTVTGAGNSSGANSPEV